jgi:hypothetical protein
VRLRRRLVLGALGLIGGLLFALVVLVAVVYARVRVPDVARLSMPTASPDPCPSVSGKGPLSATRATFRPAPKGPPGTA